MDKGNEGGRVGGPWLLAASLVAAVLVYFFPFFFQGRHMVPFHYEPSQATGIPDGGAPPSIYRKFPGGDNSPIMIHYPNAAFAGWCLQQGQLPLWNPYVGCGTPALGSGQTYPFSPFLWPFYVKPTPWVYSLGLILGLLWGATGFYLWLGRFGLPPWQRTFGALVWTFNPYSLRIVIFSNLWAAWWLGWLLWAWDRAARRAGRWWLPSVFVAGMVYSGHPEEALLLAAGSVVYAVATWAFEDAGARPPLLAWTVRVTGAVCVAGALTAVHTLPVLARLGETFTYKFGDAGRVTASHYRLLDALNPRSEVYLSPVMWGIIFLGLAAICRVGPLRRLWAVVVLLLLAVVLCFRPLLTGVFAQALTLDGLIPGIYARTLVWCSVSALVAAGAGEFMATGGQRWTALRLFLLGPLAFAGLSWGSYLDGAMVHVLLLKGLMMTYAATVLILTGALLWNRASWRHWLMAAGLAFILFLPLGEFGPGIKFYEIFNKDDPAKGGPPAVAVLREHLVEDPHARFAAAMPTGTHAPDLSPDLASLWRVRDARLVDALVMRRFATMEVEMLPKKPPFVATWFAFQGVPLRDLGLLGVRFFGVPDDAQEARFRWEEVPDALARAYVVHKVEASRDEADSLRLWKALYSTEGDYDTAIVEGWSGGAEAGRADAGDKVEWLEDGMSRVRLRTTTAEGGVLVLLDTYASGWKATVDGRPARIFPANLAFRAVEVPSGTHDVDFRYAPRSVTWGLALSGAGWLFVAALALRSRVKGRKERKPVGGGGPDTGREEAP